MLTFSDTASDQNQAGYLGDAQGRNASFEGAPYMTSADDPVDDARDKYHLNCVVSLLEEMGRVDDKKFCLELVAHLTERVGYLSAGYISTITVAELMLMSARATELAERVDKIDEA